MFTDKYRKKIKKINLIIFIVFLDFHRAHMLSCLPRVNWRSTLAINAQELEAAFTDGDIREPSDEERDAILVFAESLPPQYRHIIWTRFQRYEAGRRPQESRTLKDIEGPIDEMDCTMFVAILTAVKLGLPLDFAIVIHGDGDKPWVQESVYLGPPAKAYELLCKLHYCDGRGQWIQRISPTSNLFVGMAGTGVRIMTLEQWIALSTYDLSSWLEKDSARAQSEKTNICGCTPKEEAKVNFDYSLHEVLKFGRRQDEGFVADYSTLLLPRACFNGHNTNDAFMWSLLLKQHNCLDTVFWQRFRNTPAALWHTMG
jgi:hypothetical protein